MLAYALIQEMPNGWWKGLVSGWHGLPEQFALSHEGIIREMTSVANEYAKERTDVFHEGHASSAAAFSFAASARSSSALASRAVFFSFSTGKSLTVP